MKAVVVFALNKTGWGLATEFLPRVADVWGNGFNCRQQFKYHTKDCEETGAKWCTEEMEGSPQSSSCCESVAVFYQCRLNMLKVSKTTVFNQKSTWGWETLPFSPIYISSHTFPLMWHLQQWGHNHTDSFYISASNVHSSEYEHAVLVISLFWWVRSAAHQQRRDGENGK